jgi:hypothetical protein
VRLALFHDMERLHQEGTAEALLLVRRFLVSLSNFVAKDRAVDDVDVVHPFNFKRLLLTGLPATPSHRAEEGEGGGQLDCSLLRILLALAFSFSDEMRIGAVELLLMLAHVPAQHSRARRYHTPDGMLCTDSIELTLCTVSCVCVCVVCVCVCEKYGGAAHDAAHKVDCAGHLRCRLLC